MHYQVSIAGKRIADILPGMDMVPDSNLLFEDFFSGGESDCILTSSSLTSVQSASAVASPCFQYGHFHPSVSRLHLYSIPTATPGWRDYWRPRYLKKKKMQILEFNFDEDNFTRNPYQKEWTSDHLNRWAGHSTIGWLRFSANEHWL